MASLTFAVNDKSHHKVLHYDIPDWPTNIRQTLKLRGVKQKLILYPSVGEAEFFITLTRSQFVNLTFCQPTKKFLWGERNLNMELFLGSSELHGSRGSIHNPMNGSNKLVLNYTRLERFSSTKHSNILGPLLIYEEKEVLWIWLLVF
jgi:hypothetical protein